MQQKIILIGGGGHCKACIDVIEQTNQYEILGILDHSDLVGTYVLGYEIIGTDDDILKYVQLGCEFLITVGQIKTASVRKKIFWSLEESGAKLAIVISPHAYVSKHAEIGKGTIVMHHAMINAAATIGRNCIVNVGCDIEHDVIVGDHTHISTQAVVNGDCKIGNEVFIGSNATISNQVSITDQVIIGAGAIIYMNIECSGVYVGYSIKKS